MLNKSFSTQKKPLRYIRVAPPFGRYALCKSAIFLRRNVMEKRYRPPVLEVIRLTTSDILTGSADNDNAGSIWDLYEFNS